MHGRNPAVLPQQRAAGVIALGIAQHDVGRQVLVFAPQGIADPRPSAGRPGKILPVLHHHQRFGVIVVAAVHRADQAHVVGDRAQVGNDLRHFHAALPAAMKLEGTSQQLVGFAAGLEHLDLGRIHLAVAAIESGLGSNSSIWLGPPFCMSMITALAGAGNWLGLGADRRRTMPSRPTACHAGAEN